MQMRYTVPLFTENTFFSLSDPTKWPETGKVTERLRSGNPPLKQLEIYIQKLTEGQINFTTPESLL